MSKFYFIAHRPGIMVKTVHGTSTVPGSKVYGPYRSEETMLPHLERAVARMRGNGGAIEVLEVEADPEHPEGHSDLADLF